MYIKQSNINLWALSLIFLAGMMTACDSFAQSSSKVNGSEITWLSWEEAQEEMKKEPKKVFVDVYTDWCGWCKKMDRETFTDPEVAKYMNEHFYAVKFNAEQKETLNYQGQELNFRPGGRRGVHELAVVLLNGRLGYPSFAYLDEDMNSLHVSPGYKTPPTMLEELQQISQK